MRKTRDKSNNLVLFDEANYDKLPKEVPTYKLITPSIVSERSGGGKTKKKKWSKGKTRDRATNVRSRNIKFN